MNEWLEKILNFLAGQLSKADLKANGATPWFTVSKRIGATGYDRAMEAEEWTRRYKAACETAVNDTTLMPSDVDGDGKLDTKCNWGLHRICSMLGYCEFYGLRANAIIAKVEADNDWRKDAWEPCLKVIGEGGIAFAGIANPDGHGHVAALYPGSPIMSGNWGKLVPLCANIGKKNGIMGVNFAFPVEPLYWWKRP